MDPVTERMARNARERFAVNLRDRAVRVRRLADDMERLADKALTVDTPDFRGGRDYQTLTSVAGEVVDAVVNLMPNLGLVSLVDQGAQYEQIKNSEGGQ